MNHFLRILSTSAWAIPAACALLVAAATPARAQVGGVWNDGPTSVAPFNRWDWGQAVAPYADWDGDGAADLLVGSHQYAAVVSSATGAALLEVSGPTGLFGYDVSDLGDVDGDGVHDFVVARPDGAGWVHVFSGATGVQLYQVQSPTLSGTYGRAVQGVGDVTGDGVPDFLVADPWASEAYLQSGDTGAVHASIAMNGGDLGGYALAALPDVTGDGLPDYAVGNYAAYPRGEVKLATGASGTVLQHWVPAGSDYDSFGDALAPIEDVDGDGLADLVVGDTGYVSAAGWYAGRVEVRSSADGSLLWHVDSPQAYLGFGEAVVSPGDVDGDGVADVAVGVPQLDRGWRTEVGGVVLLAGADGSLLNLWWGGGNGDEFGTDLACGDFDGDGVAQDLAVGVPFVGHPFPDGDGEVVVLLRDPFLRPTVAEVSGAAGGSVALEAHFPVAAAGDDYQLLLSVSGIGPATALGLEVPLTDDPFFQRTLSGDYGMFPSVTNPVGQLDAQGRANVVLTFGPGDLAAHVGRTAWLAVLASEQGAGTFTSAPTRLVVVP